MLPRRVVLPVGQHRSRRMQAGAMAGQEEAGPPKPPRRQLDDSVHILLDLGDAVGRQPSCGEGAAERALDGEGVRFLFGRVHAVVCHVTCFHMPTIGSGPWAWPSEHDDTIAHAWSNMRAADPPRSKSLIAAEVRSITGVDS